MKTFNYWREIFRFLVSLQLLPALESGEETLVGGQAVFDGVMMRSPHAWGIAVRKASGEVAVHSETLQKSSDQHKWMGWPFIRGIFSITFLIVMYKYVPLVLTTKLKGSWHALGNNLVFNLVDGFIRIALFLLFIWGISLWPDIKHMFRYHGAEHKTVFAFEDHHGMPSVADAQKYSTYHPRCGTSFLMTIMLISIFVYAAFPVTRFWPRFGLRVVMLPVIASVSYELIRFSARHGRSLFALLTKPGLWLQRITTQPPTDGQVECAIRALDEAMALEKVNGG